ncbi:MAG TPA: nuclear transport factor 2 family protein [Steroidobacteraceae bacterium]|nr:nuclear transport factor 2 family protein [Steroidobacteraceae bacterium]
MTPTADENPRAAAALSRRQFNTALLGGLTAFAAGSALKVAAAAQSGAVSFDVDTSPGAAASARALQNFRTYLDAFNRNDFDGFSRYYLPDIDFRGRGGTFAGRDAVLDFYRGVKSKVQETLTLRGLVVGREQWVADVVTELRAQQDWPDFPTGALKKGETRRSENFIWYELEGDKFKRVRSGRHSGNPPMAAPQSLIVADSAQPAFRAEEFAAYMDGFNHDDYAAFGDHYTDDVKLVIAGDRALSGRQAIFDFYKTVKSQTRRTIQINRLVTTPGLFAAELQSEFLALTDLPDFVAGPMKKGGRIFINTFVIYELKGGRFWRIRSAEYRKENRGVA